MSCNKENIKRLSTITVDSHQFGRVVGQLTRLTGCSGYLTAICERGYKFDGWYDTEDQLLSTELQLYVVSWMDMTVEPRFSEIIITVTDASAMDANESLVYYIEKHGQNEGSMHANFFPVATHYSAGNFSSSNGSTSRIMIDGSQTCEFPVTYGYNYGVVGVDDDGNNISDIGAGTYDPVTNTSTGVWLRNPATHDLKTEISVPKILSTPRDTIRFPTEETVRGGRSVSCSTTPTTYSGHNGRFDTYNSPTDGSKSSQFPLLQYHQGVNIRNNYHDETIDFAGLEGGDFQTYYSRNLSSHKGRYIRDLDAVSEWKDLFAFGTYGYNYQHINSAMLGFTDVSPRLIDPFVYNSNLTNFFLPSNPSSGGPRQAVDVNINPQWTSVYQTKPQSGSYMNPFRYGLLTNFRTMEKTMVDDYSLTTNYFQSLKGISNYYSSTGYTDLDLSVGDYRNITYLYLNTHQYVLSLEPFTDSNNLQLINLRGSVNRKIPTLAPLENKKINNLYTENFLNIIHDSIYEERVKLHMDFNSNNILTQDSTRHANKLNNHGAIVVDT